MTPRLPFPTEDPATRPDVGEWPSADLEAVPACPACRSSRRTTRHADLTDENSHCAPGRWRLASCSACGTAYLDPRPTRATIGRAYRSYYTHDGLGHEEVSRLAALLFATLRPRPGADRLMDVGAGTGKLVLSARRRGWNAEGVDPDAGAVAAARTQGLQVELGIADALEPSAYDVVTMNHVIEHMHDPVDALRACRRGLRPGGSLWIATPNVGSLGHRVFGTAWYGLDPPRHIAVFSRTGLASALSEAGFGRVEWRPSVGSREALARIRRVVRHRRKAAAAPVADQPTGGSGTARPEQEPRLARRIARHALVHTTLRAAEVAVPATADELLLCAWAA